MYAVWLGAAATYIYAAATYSAGQKKSLNFANISATKDRIFMKFETYAHETLVDHLQNFQNPPFRMKYVSAF